ncbi:MAG: SPFH domain-containing protein [Solobacterium sp.]|nr:SPFH domain-containing protein [Solobacterium sp.]
MGLIQAAVSAATSTFADQWKEYFYCEAIPSSVLMVKGQKKTRGFSSNHGDDNIISDGSVIAVADGQCMIIVEQGQVVDICAQPGEFKYDSSTEPSIFTGSLGEGIKNVFATIGKRFTFGGQPAEDQRVYYVNTKELPGLKYGTPSPVPFRVIDKNINLDIDISVKCFGEYSLRVADPISFYTNVAGNISSTYRVDQLESQLKTELLTALSPAFAQLSASGVRYSEIPAHTMELADALNAQLSAKWKDLRGLEIVSFGVSSIKASEEDEQMIKEAQRDAIYKDQTYAAGSTVAAYNQALKDAAKNQGGAAVGLMGVNMVNQATGGGINVGQLYSNGTAQQAAPSPAPATAAAGWTCPECGTVNTGNFCGQCGAKKPAVGKWICPKCGTENDANFCGQCGEKKPA